jgi:hypothetical protein
MMSMTADELLRFERRWKLVFLVFAILFVTALLDHMLCTPHGWEAFGCYILGGLGFFGCLYSGRKLGDSDRIDAALGGLSLFDEDISIDLGDFPD